jgi:hypothetical protein
MATGRRPPLWAIAKRAKELGATNSEGSVTVNAGNVVSLRVVRLQRSIIHELQAAREARFRVLSEGRGRPQQDKA